MSDLANRCPWSACAPAKVTTFWPCRRRAPDARQVSATLVEYEPRNVAAAWTRAIAEGLDTVTVAPADAGDLASYRQAVPADLVIMAGVLGNISDADAQSTIHALPQLCAADAAVIWTRTRRALNLTPAVRSRVLRTGVHRSRRRAVLRRRSPLDAVVLAWSRIVADQLRAALPPSTDTPSL
ncbi:hypothetical protein V6U90_31675 [Micromonospora sp. CPCC 206060]|uniref:hypothetical protein n=1 Tax=Micromonospora sp. CPCC 206060 TaxID=3122406 RepID=UPI002FF2EBDA